MHHVAPHGAIVDLGSFRGDELEQRVVVLLDGGESPLQDTQLDVGVHTVQLALPTKTETKQPSSSRQSCLTVQLILPNSEQANILRWRYIAATLP